jgi:mannonate dehydratase
VIQIAEMLPSQPSSLWKLAKQVGIDHAVSPLPFEEGCTEQPWEIGPLSRLKERFEAAGFNLSVIESSPPMQKTRLGLPGRDGEIEQFKTLLRNMGALGIPVICYNWMAGIGWSRTRVNIPARGGALVSGYFSEDWSEEPLTEYGEVSEDRLWDSLAYYLKNVVPVAEQSGVKLAMHPDDPPISPIRGIGRIMRSVENFQRLVDMYPSENNGITLCQGNFALMTDDLPGVIRHFGSQNRIFFVHMRDVQGTADNFVETFHDAGPTDMLACLRAYKEIGFEGVLRPDHVPSMEGEDNAKPGYATLGRLFAIGYIKGLQEAVYGKPLAVNRQPSIVFV